MYNSEGTMMTTAVQRNEAEKITLRMVVNGTNIRVNLRDTIAKMIVPVAVAVAMAPAVVVLTITVMMVGGIEEEVTITEVVLVDRGEEAVEASEVMGPAMVVAATDLQKCSKICDRIQKARKMPNVCLPEQKSKRFLSRKQATDKCETSLFHFDSLRRI
jgi:hypothetical protein